MMNEKNRFKKKLFKTIDEIMTDEVKAIGIGVSSSSKSRIRYGIRCAEHSGMDKCSTKEFG